MNSTTAFNIDFSDDMSFTGSYNRALAAGKLSDFSTSANLYNIEQGYIQDAYSSIGNIAAQGAFDWGDAPNESDYWITAVDPGGSSSTDESTDWCDEQCYSRCQVSPTECEECWISCVTGTYISPQGP